MSRCPGLRRRLAGIALVLGTATAPIARAEPLADSDPARPLSETLTGASKRDYDTALMLY